MVIFGLVPTLLGRLPSFRIGGMIGHGPPDQDQLRRHAIAAHGEGVAAAVVGAIDQRAAHTLGTTPQF
jgi:hypothetical protein